MTTREELIEAARKALGPVHESGPAMVAPGVPEAVVDAVLAKLSEDDSGRVERAAKEMYEQWTGLPWEVQDSPCETLSQKQVGARAVARSILDAAGPVVVIPSLAKELNQAAESSAALVEGLHAEVFRLKARAEKAERRARDAEGQAELFRGALRKAEEDPERVERVALAIYRTKTRVVPDDSCVITHGWVAHLEAAREVAEAALDAAGPVVEREVAKDEWIAEVMSQVEPSVRQLERERDTWKETARSAQDIVDHWKARAEKAEADNKHLSEYVREAAGDESVLIPVSTLEQFNESAAHKLRVENGELKAELECALTNDRVCREKAEARLATQEEGWQHYAATQEAELAWLRKVEQAARAVLHGRWSGGVSTEDLTRLQAALQGSEAD